MYVMHPTTIYTDASRTCLEGTGTYHVSDDHVVTLHSMEVNDVYFNRKQLVKLFTEAELDNLIDQHGDDILALL